MEEVRPFLPFRMIKVEIAARIPDLFPEEDDDGVVYRRALVFVWLHERPLGTVELDLPGGALAAEKFAHSIWSNLRDQINAHLQQDGLLVVDHLPVQGLPAVDQPPCLRARNRVLSDAPFASVLIATRDRPETLGKCLDSLLDMEYPHFEIIIVDNAPSSDATAQYIARRFPDSVRVRYVREDRPGLACAHNRGLDEVKAPYVAITDDDVTVDRYWLAELMAGFRSAPGVGCVTGMIFPAEIRTEAQYWVEQSVGYSKGYLRRIFNLASDKSVHPLFPYAAGMFGSGANMAFDTAILRKTGRFDDRLGIGSLSMGGDDLAAFFQIIVHGYTLVYEPAAVIYHPHHRAVDRLRRQAYGYGAGLTAYLTKTVIDYPGRFIQFALKVPYGLYYVFSKRSAKNKRLSSNYPVELTRLERRGMLVGPYLYLKDRWRTRGTRRSGLRGTRLPSYRSESDKAV